MLRALAADLDLSMAEVVDKAVRELQRQRFWAKYLASYAALQTDPAARAQFQTEIAAWDATLSDGLEDKANERREGRRKAVTR
jgi:hypothetical protein